MIDHLNPHATTLTTLYIVRHGESFDNAGIPYPRTPEGPPLTDKGREQAQAVARQLADVPAEAVLASHLIRARQTAEFIASPRGLDVRIIPEIHERFIGSSDGRADLHELDEYRELFEEYQRGTDDAKMRWKLTEEWESLNEASDRFIGGLTRIADDYRNKTVIAVAHGTVMRTFLISTGFGTLSELPDGSVDNTGYIVVQTNGSRWTIIDTAGIHRMEAAATSSAHGE